MKSLFAALIFTFALVPATSQASTVATDSLTPISGGDTISNDDFELNLDSPFFFQEKVYIHIYDKNEQPLLSKAFSKKEIEENQELQALLKKSTLYLTLDQHYYYTVEE